MAGHLAEARGGVTLPGQAEEDPARAEDVAVDGGERGGDHDGIEDVRRRRDAQAAEDLHERAAVGADLVPREQAHQHAEGQHVEQQHPHGDGVDSLRDDRLGVGSLTGGDAQGLDPAEREHHDGEGGKEPFEAVGEHAAVLHQVAQARSGRRAAGLEAEDDDGRAADDHGDDGRHLDQREPELQFAEDLHAQQVQGGQEEDDGQHPDPALHLGEPESHVDTEGGDVSDGHDRHLEDVGPAGHKAGQRSEVAARVLAERAGDRVPHRHFPQGAHHHEHGRAADHVGEQHARPGFLDGGRGAVEQPGSDRGPEGHEADMADVESPAEHRFDGGADGFGRCCRRVLHRSREPRAWWRFGLVACEYLLVIGRGIAIQQTISGGAVMRLTGLVSLISDCPGAAWLPGTSASKPCAVSGSRRRPPNAWPQGEPPPRRRAVRRGGVCVGEAGLEQAGGGERARRCAGAGVWIHGGAAPGPDHQATG